MTTSSNPESGKPAGFLETVKQAKDIVDLGSWVVTTGIGILSFLRMPGSLMQFLIEAGVYGVACYAALFIFLIPTVLLFDKLDKMFGRVTNDTAFVIIASVAVLGGGLLIRSTFHPSFTTDLDAFGAGFGALLGVVTLAIPVLLWWYHRGSTPRTAK